MKISIKTELIYSFPQATQVIAGMARKHDLILLSNKRAI